MVLFGIPEALLVIVPFLEEKILGFPEVPASLEHSPAAGQGVHVAPDRDLLARHCDGRHAALSDQIPLHEVRARGRRVWLWFRSRYGRQNDPPGVIV